MQSIRQKSSAFGAWVVAAAALLGGCTVTDMGDAELPVARAWDRPAARRGLVTGQVLDVETGGAVAGAEIEIVGADGAPRRARSRADGTFEAEVPAGRARVKVKAEGHIASAREVAVGETALGATYKMVRRAPAKPIGRAGGVVEAEVARLEIPPEAYRDGAAVSVTYASRARVPAVVAQAQFVDDAQVPRRALAAVAVEGTEPPAMPVRMQVPVPADATLETVAAHLVEEDGDFGPPIRPERIEASVATFVVPGDGTYGVAVDTRKADDKRVGYLVVDGEGVMEAGAVLPGGSEIATVRRGLSVVDPQGTRIDVAPASRARLAAPSQEADPGPFDAAAPSGPRRGRSAAYAGEVALEEGTARFVVSDRHKADGLVRLGIDTPNGRFQAKGTAFTVTTCARGGQAIDTLEVVEGTVEALVDERTTPVGAGQAVVLCRGCAAGSAPVCGEAPGRDAGAPAPGRDAASPADGRPAPGADAGAPVVDARAEDAPPAAGADAAPNPPLDAGTPDRPAPLDGGAIGERPDASPAPRDAAATGPLDAPARDAGPGAARLTMAPTMHGFGAHPVGGTSDEAVFTLKNEGDLQSDVPVIALAGADAPSFTITRSGCEAHLAPGASCAIGVRFVPGMAGGRSAALTATTAAGVASATVTGSGLGPSQLVLAPESRDFGALPVGTPSGVQTLVLRNAGESRSGMAAISLAGAHPGDFEVHDNGCGAPLEAGASCTLRVRFVAKAKGPRSAALAASAQPGGDAVAMLTGSGTEALVVAPTSLAYPTTVVGSTAAALTVTVTNTGAAPAGPLLSALTGADATEFAIVNDGCGGKTLVANGACDVAVTFAPKAAGSKAAAVEISGSPGGGGASAALVGSAVAAARLEIDPASFDFGTAPIGGHTAPHAFTVKNVGGAPTGALALALGDKHAHEFEIVANGCVNAGALAPQATCTVEVKLAPASAGSKVATLTASATPGGAATATLTGAGARAAGLSIDPGGWTADAAIGKTVVTFTVTNGGAATTGALAVTLDNPNDFRVFNDRCGQATLQPKATCQLDVEFTRRTSGQATGTLTVSGSPGGSATVPLSGTGAATQTTPDAGGTTTSPIPTAPAIDAGGTTTAPGPTAPTVDGGI